MTKTTREEIRQYVRNANRLGQPLATPVGYQLLEIANNDIGAARVYWSDYGEEKQREKPWYFTPNQTKGKFVSTVKAVLERSVNNAYMLPSEQRQAAEIFRTFYNHAAEIDWDNKEAFEQLSQEYDRVSQSMIGVLTTATQRVSNLRTRRFLLMEGRDLPHRI